MAKSTTQAKQPEVPTYPCPCGWLWSVKVVNTGICPKCGREYFTSLKDGIFQIKFLDKK